MDQTSPDNGIRWFIPKQYHNISIELQDGMETFHNEVCVKWLLNIVAAIAEFIEKADGNLAGAYDNAKQAGASLNRAQWEVWMKYLRRKNFLLPCPDKNNRNQKPAEKPAVKPPPQSKPATDKASAKKKQQRKRSPEEPDDLFEKLLKKAEKEGRLDGVFRCKKCGMKYHAEEEARDCCRPISDTD
ncbi:MAG: hypothetical protein V1838_05155 [Patescibacteria group bacterium]